MNSANNRFPDLRTVGYTMVMLVTIAVIMHVVLRDLLAYLPDYDLTSAVVLIMLGGLAIIAPFLLFGRDGHTSLSPYPESEKKGYVPDLKSVYLTIILLMIMGIIITWNGIMPLFDLDSVVYTLIGGALALTVSSMSRRHQAAAGSAASGEMKQSP